MSEELDLKAEFIHQRTNLKSLATMITFVKQRVDKLEEAFDKLRAEVGAAQIPAELQAELATLREALANDSSRKRRAVHAKPLNIAVACYLIYRLNVPMYRVAKAGVLTQAKAAGVGTWGAAYAAEQMEKLGFGEEYRNGFALATMLEVIQDTAPLPEIATVLAEQTQVPPLADLPTVV